MGSGEAGVQPTFAQSALVALDRADNNSTAAVVKTVVGVTSLTTFLLGLRSAWKHSRQPEAADLARAQIYSGVGFAGKALAVATVLTVSGFSLFIVGVSWALNVNTPRQFGSAMRRAFGDNLRLASSTDSQSGSDCPERPRRHSDRLKEAMFIPITILVGILILVVVLLLSVRNRFLPLCNGSRVLLVIAHPDDETMFFAPTIRGLRQAGHRVFLLCVSSGNFYGEGTTRRRELIEAVERLGISPSDTTILDYEAFQDGDSWSRHPLSLVIMRHVEVLAVDAVISFDQGGVSGHGNHASCFEALQTAYTHGVVPRDVHIFVLDSIPLWRKYIGLLDAPFSCHRSPFFYVARFRDIRACWRAMLAHRSQLVWFRVLFIIFSRYVYMNSLRRISPLPLVANSRCKSRNH
ncbi:unnamed protein product [Caenorhabditis auriculariae]|uniref:N-acetylglucosaminylphosphatidylinositol deacetylase n=1 Tax=Caenorhabditis auriculariae TaxID=2777116 RepID=A0A8S1H650_9PELO|nr:unnamed protein product [Caenorhabditis auriculariae]